MIQISIYRNNKLTNQAQFETQQEADAWFEREKANHSFGKPAGEYEINSLSVEELFTELSRREENGIYITIPDQFEVMVNDVTDASQQEAINLEARAYLAETDWYVIRKMDTGVAVPAEIELAREQARQRIK